MLEPWICQVNNFNELCKKHDKQVWHVTWHGPTFSQSRGFRQGHHMLSIQEALYLIQKVGHDLDG